MRPKPIRRICTSSMTLISIPITVTPPTQIANELNQQQLVPIKKAIMPPNNVFLYGLI